MDRLKEHLFKLQDIKPLIYFRLAFGGIMLWEVIRYFAFGRIARYYIEPKYFFHYYDWSFIKPLGATGMYVAFFLLGVFSLMVTIGLFYRLAATGVFIIFTYTFLLDESRYLNHFYLLSLVSFLMIFIPTHRDMSLDAIRKPQIRTNLVPAWYKYLLIFQVSCPYFFGGIAKLNSDWLHGEPMRMWLARRLDFPFIGQYFKEEWVVYFFSYGGLIFDLIVVPLLLWRKTRVVTFVFAALFHMLNDQLFLIGVFPWFMLAATAILFFDLWPAFWRKWKWFSNTTEAPSIKPRSTKWIIYTLAIYVAIQVFLPFRHLLYPGNVNWTEEGHKFSWHMKLRSKIGYCRFFIEDKFNNQRKEISPGFFLTELQNRKMAGNPEMILQFAHFLKDNLAKEGIRNVKVKAVCFSSLNNRRMQLLVDSNIDLAAQEETWRHYDWIVPLTEPLPTPR